MFREGANRGNLRCMKDLADYGAKLRVTWTVLECWITYERKAKHVIHI